MLVVDSEKDPMIYAIQYGVILIKFSKFVSKRQISGISMSIAK